MQEVDGSVRSDGRPGDVSSVGLEPELGGDGVEAEVWDDTTPPVRSSPSGAGVEPEAAPSPGSSVEDDPPRPRFNRYASSAVVEQMVSLRHEGLTVDEIAEQVRPS